MGCGKSTVGKSLAASKNLTFIDGDMIRGVESNAIYTLGTFSTIDNQSTEYDQNQAIEVGADDLIDWGETNPFGEFGNYTGSF